MVHVSRQPRTGKSPVLAAALGWVLPALGFTLPAAALGALLCGVVLCAAPDAQAEEPAAEGSIEEQIREQMEKIRRLMRENERALFLLSTGSEAATQRVEVEIPPGQPDGAGNSDRGSGDRGASDGAAGEGAEGQQGKAARQEMEEALRKLASDSPAIPVEIERLVKMIPLSDCSGGNCGQPQPKDGKPSGELPDPTSMRDERRSPAEREAAEQAERERQRREQGEKPESGGRSEKEPQPGSTGRSDEPDGTQRPDDGSQDWRASLPAELRDAAAGGRWEQIPERYRALIERYWRWIEERRRSGR